MFKQELIYSALILAFSLVLFFIRLLVDHRQRSQDREQSPE